MVCDNTDIQEANFYTPESLEDTCVNIELSITYHAEVPQFFHAIKRFWDANGITIGTANNTPVLDTILYKLVYQYGYKSDMY